MKTQKNILWDIPTRLFHWILVISIFISWLSHELENIELHVWAGYSVITLLLFRITWGFTGSYTSRFTTFIKSPAAVIKYLKGENIQYTGHNPSGAYSVVALLVICLVQVITGLFMTDEITFDAPLYPFVSDDLAETMAVIHEINFNVLLFLISLHVLAVLYYVTVKGQGLIRSMITGNNHQDNSDFKIVSNGLAIVCLLASIVLCYLVVNLLPQWLA